MQGDLLTLKIKLEEMQLENNINTNQAKLDEAKHDAQSGIDQSLCPDPTPGQPLSMVETNIGGGEKY